MFDPHDFHAQGPIGHIRSRVGSFVALLILISLIALAVSLRQNSWEDNLHQRVITEEQAIGVTRVVATRVADGLADVQRFVEQAALWGGSDLAQFDAVIGRFPLDRAMVRGVAVLDRTGPDRSGGANPAEGGLWSVRLRVIGPSGDGSSGAGDDCLEPGCDWSWRQRDWRYRRCAGFRDGSRGAGCSAGAIGPAGSGF